MELTPAGLLWMLVSLPPAPFLASDTDLTLVNILISKTEIQILHSPKVVELQNIFRARKEFNKC